MSHILEIDLLRSFVAVAETGSFTQAADRIHRTQSAISMQIKKLEDQLGVSLFNRTSRQVFLTPKGELLLSKAKEILKLHRETVHLIMNSDMSGRVVLGIPDDFAHKFLPPILARFSRTNPYVEVDVVCACSTDLIPQVQKGNIDIAIVASETEGLGAIEAFTERGVWVVDENYGPHLSEPIPLAVFEKGDGLRLAAEKSLKRIGKPYRIAYSSASIAGIQAVISAGLAVGAISESSVLPSMHILTETDGFPDLPDTVFSLLLAPAKDDPALFRLRDHILESLSAISHYT